MNFLTKCRQKIKKDKIARLSFITAQIRAVTESTSALSEIEVAASLLQFDIIPEAAPVETAFPFWDRELR